MILAAGHEEIVEPEARGSDPYRSPGEAGQAERRLTSLVYSGQRSAGEGTVFVVRRIDLASKRPRTVWEYTAPEPGILAPERYGRLGDLIVAPMQQGGVTALELATGAARWILPYSVPLGAPPAVGADGTLRLRFVDQTWMRVDPATGRVLETRVLPPPSPDERPLISPLPLDAAPIGESLRWTGSAVSAVDPATGAAVPVVDFRIAGVSYEGCFVIDRLLLVRASVIDTSGEGTLPRRLMILVDPRRWRPLLRVPDTDGHSVRIHDPEWVGRL
jgi:hypothetical protein